MDISRAAVQRFYNATKIFRNSLRAAYEGKKCWRRVLRDREFRKAQREWDRERALFASNVDPGFEFAFADLFDVFSQFGIELETVCEILGLMGCNITE